MDVLQAVSSIRAVLSQNQSSEYPEVAQAAWEAQNLTDQLEAGQLTKQEYEELLADTLDIRRVVGLMEEQERKQQIAQVLDFIKSHIGSVLSLVL